MGGICRRYRKKAKGGKVGQTPKLRGAKQRELAEEESIAAKTRKNKSLKGWEEKIWTPPQKLAPPQFENAKEKGFKLKNLEDRAGNV